jgi:hypothetical protein
VPGDDSEGVERAFGAQNRARLLSLFLDTHPPIGPDDAWKAIYRLLLWTDRTIGLAHCYESDKCQPGRPWYARSLAFHGWLASELGVEPADVGGEIDWLFRTAVADFADQDADAQLAKAQEQRRPYAGRDFPTPGEDLGLVSVVHDALGDYLDHDPSSDTWRRMSERVTAYLRQENKRKNLLGEGFEDTLAAIIRRMPESEGWEIRTRVLLGDIPGFNPQGEEEKQKRVDLVLSDTANARHILVTAKWSVRADREEQFGTDFQAYVRANVARPFDHVLVTNEFDAARLKHACIELAANAHLFHAVVHVNPHGLLHAHGTPLRRSAAELPGLIEAGRLVSLSHWLGRTLSS